MSARNGQANKVLALFKNQGTITLDDVVHKVGMTTKRAAATLHQMNNAGKIYRARTGYQSSIYFPDKAGRDAYVALHGEYVPPMQREPTLKISAPVGGLKPNQPAVIPEGVKVTIGPAWTHDDRFQTAPGEVVIGEFSKLGVGRYLGASHGA